MAFLFTMLYIYNIIKELTKEDEMRFSLRNICFLRYVSLLIAFSFLIYGCSGKPPSEEIVIKVNDYSITRDEFNELFKNYSGAEESEEAREAFIGTLITRKLILEEGQKAGLDKETDFMRSVQNFWEQALLKITIDKKIEELSRGIDVDDKEVEDYHREWAKANPDSAKTLEESRGAIRWKLLKDKQAMALDSWIKGLKRSARIKVDREAIGL
jgi:hypothetical protein